MRKFIATLLYLIALPISIIEIIITHFSKGYFRTYLGLKISYLADKIKKS